MAFWILSLSQGLGGVPAEGVAELNAKYTERFSPDIEKEARSGSCKTYYSTCYYLQGLLSAAEGTKSESALKAAMSYIDLMLAESKDLNHDGLPEWGAKDASTSDLDPDGRPWMLYHFQAELPIARAAAVILRNDEWRRSYRTNANSYIQFVDRSIFKYWLDRKSGVYKIQPGRDWPWRAGMIPQISSTNGGYGPSGIWSDKASLLACISALLYQATGDPLYREVAERIGTDFKARLHPQGGGYIWDEGKPLSEWKRAGYPDYESPAHDTSHANREAMMVVLLYEAGIVFTETDLDRMAYTFTDAICKGSEGSPHFTNYIDGSDAPLGRAKAGGVGNVFDGWILLGRYSARVQATGCALAAAIEKGGSIGQNGSSYGRLELTGHLLRNSLPVRH